MREYLLKRVLLMVPTLFLVAILVFLMMRLIPGDVVLQMLEGYAYADSVEALRQELGLDKPMHIQYLEWMSTLLRGDLGRFTVDQGKHLPVGNHPAAGRVGDR